MKTLWLALGLLHLLCAPPAGAAPHVEPPKSVPLVALLANPTAYDGQRVHTEGFISLEFEDSALYLDRDGWNWSTGQNAVWIDAPRHIGYPAKHRVSRKYAVITATFRVQPRSGHMGAFSGRLENIEAVTALRDRSAHQRWLLRYSSFDLRRLMMMGVLFVAAVTGLVYLVARRR